MLRDKYTQKDMKITISEEIENRITELLEAVPVGVVVGERFDLGVSF